ncbi:hypothetical protein [Thermoflavimicrobium dichotomicum]|uniref:Uncharacterized protein n=1 Tax=Thermoflavimicrobium dichotomicum TaxID=46223 RepID=A0A1I3LD60_9BACL|nr:hypothetical protein [Thermoflavimicrobium dichotomicum]SFI82668.1 hypothetical protein SAMN05421852_102141 [Thermoflavimicrobium dichotomicum]
MGKVVIGAKITGWVGMTAFLLLVCGLWLETIFSVVMGLVFVRFTIFVFRRSFSVQLASILLIIANMAAIWWGVRLSLEYNNLAIIKSKGFYTYLAGSFHGFFSEEGLWFTLVTGAITFLERLMIDVHYSRKKLAIFRRLH